MGVEILSRYPSLCLDQGKSNEGFHSTPKPFRMIGVSLAINDAEAGNTRPQQF
jgi:hypothetical protein